MARLDKIGDKASKKLEKKIKREKYGLRKNPEGYGSDLSNRMLKKYKADLVKLERSIKEDGFTNKTKQHMNIFYRKLSHNVNYEKIVLNRLKAAKNSDVLMAYCILLANSSRIKTIKTLTKHMRARNSINEKLFIAKSLSFQKDLQQNPVKYFRSFKMKNDLGISSIGRLKNPIIREALANLLEQQRSKGLKKEFIKLWAKSADYPRFNNFTERILGDINNQPDAASAVIYSICNTLAEIQQKQNDLVGSLLKLNEIKGVPNSVKKTLLQESHHLKNKKIQKQLVLPWVKKILTKPIDWTLVSSALWGLTHLAVKKKMDADLENIKREKNKLIHLYFDNLNDERRLCNYVHRFIIYLIYNTDFFGSADNVNLTLSNIATAYNNHHNKKIKIYLIKALLKMKVKKISESAVKNKLNSLYNNTHDEQLRRFIKQEREEVNER